MKKIKITQVRSAVDRPARQKRSLVALGIHKMHQTVEHNATPQILGVIEKVKHLVTVEEQRTGFRKRRHFHTWTQGRTIPFRLQP